MSKVLILADIHANLPALKAVLEAVSAHDLDAVWCAGDLVGYGNQPNECVAIMRELGAVCVRGNHERFVLGVIEGEDFNAYARESGVWTRDVLTEDNRAFLEGLPDEMTMKDGTVIAHGAPGEPDRYLFGMEELQEVAKRQEKELGGGVTVVGHTHEVVLADAGRVVYPECGIETLETGRRYVLNPGSVGQGRMKSLTGAFALYETGAQMMLFNHTPI